MKRVQNYRGVEDLPKLYRVAFRGLYLACYDHQSRACSLSKLKTRKLYSALVRSDPWDRCAVKDLKRGPLTCGLASVGILNSSFHESSYSKHELLPFCMPGKTACHTQRRLNDRLSSRRRTPSTWRDSHVLGVGSTLVKSLEPYQRRVRSSRGEHKNDTVWVGSSLDSVRGRKRRQQKRPSCTIFGYSELLPSRHDRTDRLPYIRRPLSVGIRNSCWGRELIKTVSKSSPFRAGAPAKPYDKML